MAEHSAVNRRVVGSSPTSGAKYIEMKSAQGSQVGCHISFVLLAVLAVCLQMTSEIFLMLLRSLFINCPGPLSMDVKQASESFGAEAGGHKGVVHDSSSTPGGSACRA